MRRCVRAKPTHSVACQFFGTQLYPPATDGNDPDSAALLEADVRMQLVAKEYSARYNELGVPKPVDFVA